jgi:hypothetical protein
MQQEQAGVGGDADLHLIGDRQPAAPFKNLFRQKNLDVPFQFPAIRLRQPAIEWAVRLNHPLPVNGKRGGLQFLSSVLFPHRLLARSWSQTVELSRLV